MRRANEPDQLQRSQQVQANGTKQAAPKRGKHVTHRSKSNGTDRDDCEWHSIPNKLHRSKTKWWSHSNSQLLSQVRKTLRANSLWWITFSPIKIHTRVIWSTLAALQRAPKRSKPLAESAIPGKISSIHQLRVSLRQTFFAFARASAPRWH